MISELKSIIKDERFKTLLNNPAIWESIDVDYNTPRVERVWMTINDKRLCLHVIHPCKENEAFLHSHVWESAMYVLPIGGLYEHTLGYRLEKWDEPEIVCKQIVEGGMYYEMLNPAGIHSVRPIAQPVFSIMLSGKPIWKENYGTIDKKLVSLSDERKKEILLIFKNYFE